MTAQIIIDIMLKSGYKAAMTMKPEELTKLYNSLSAEQQEEFSKIAKDYVKASDDPDVVPMLLNVSKSTLESGAGMVRIPISQLTENAATERRHADKLRMQSYREQQSPEEKAQQRIKDAERKRISRARTKNQSSDPSP